MISVEIESAFKNPTLLCNHYLTEEEVRSYPIAFESFIATIKEHKKMKSILGDVKGTQYPKFDFYQSLESYQVFRDYWSSCFSKRLYEECFNEKYPLMPHSQIIYLFFNRMQIVFTKEADKGNNFIMAQDQWEYALNYQEPVLILEALIDPNNYIIFRDGLVSYQCIPIGDKRTFYTRPILKAFLDSLLDSLKFLLTLLNPTNK